MRARRPSNTIAANTGHVISRPRIVNNSNAIAQIVFDAVAQRRGCGDDRDDRRLPRRQNQHDERQKLRQPDQAEIERVARIA